MHISKEEIELLLKFEHNFTKKKQNKLYYKIYFNDNGSNALNQNFYYIPTENRFQNIYQ